MLSHFKLRMLLVILVVAMITISMRTNQNKTYIKPVLEYVLKDYGIQQKLWAWTENLNKPGVTAPAVFNPQDMQLPCAYLAVEQAYGWYWSSDDRQDKLFPGIRLKVSENSPVKPVMEGRVVELGKDAAGRTVLLQHSQELYSLYGGLKEVLVDQGSTVSKTQPLGKNSSSLYLEVRGRDGPIDPGFLLE